MLLLQLAVWPIQLLLSKQTKKKSKISKPSIKKTARLTFMQQVPPLSLLAHTSLVPHPKRRKYHNWLMMVIPLQLRVSHLTIKQPKTAPYTAPCTRTWTKLAALRRPSRVLLRLRAWANSEESLLDTVTKLSSLRRRNWWNRESKHSRLSSGRSTLNSSRRPNFNSTK